MCDDDSIPCYIKTLPAADHVAAAATAFMQNPANRPATEVVTGELLQPAHLALLTSRYWGVGGVALTVGFLDDPKQVLRNMILSHMNAWGKYSNVLFVESDPASNADVRIARKVGDGHWSYLGTDIKHVPKGQPTMNLEGFTERTSDAEFRRVVRHETGHTMGFPHEHLRKEIVGLIDPQKATAYYGGAPNFWSPAQVKAQVLTPIDNATIRGTAQADVHSIMCYHLPASIMKNGKGVPGGTDIDVHDEEFAAAVYPPVHRGGDRAEWEGRDGKSLSEVVQFEAQRLLASAVEAEVANQSNGI